jgi:hypothetical protein
MIQEHTPRVKTWDVSFKNLDLEDMKLLRQVLAHTTSIDDRFAEYDFVCKLIEQEEARK